MGVAPELVVADVRELQLAAVQASPSLIILKYALIPSATTEKTPPVGLFVWVAIAATWISVSLTPGAVTWTFFLRSSGLTEFGRCPLRDRRRRLARWTRRSRTPPR